MEKYQLCENASLTIDFENAVLSELRTGEENIVRGKVPLFSLKLRDRKGNSRILSARDFSFVSFDGAVATYGSEEADVQLVLRQKGNALTCRVNVDNKTDDLLEWTEALSFGVRQKLKDEEGGVGEILYPYNEGCLVTDMAYRESMPFKYAEPDYPSVNGFSVFPNMVCSQFLAYLYEGKGVYLGMHDEERTTKHIDFRYDEGCIRLQMRAFCDVGYGENYRMPFDCVLQFFDGDWHDAAEIYRQWFLRHLPAGLKKIRDNDALPEWYAASPVVVIYPVRGERESDTKPNGLFPYECSLPMLKNISDRTDSRVMALLMHWEGTAPWAPPYAWPPYGGEDLFAGFVRALHERGDLVGLYYSGLGWTQRSKIDKNYRCEEQFEKQRVGDLVCGNSDGAVDSTICKSIRDGYDLCPHCEGTRKLFVSEVEKMTASGVDYVQALDQNHGGNSYFCYSDAHGHVPAPGKWQSRAVLRMLESIDRKKALFGCESAAAEPFLSQLAFSDNRFELDYYVGRPVPLYAYLYHEFINNFMGNQICSSLEKTDFNFTYRVAYAFTAGDMLTVTMKNAADMTYSWCDYVEPRDLCVDQDVALAFIRELNGWRKGAGAQFLHYGKMVKPQAIRCGKKRFLLEDGKTCLTVDEVLTTAYEVGDERAQFYVNYTMEKVTLDIGEEAEVFENSAAEAGARKKTIKMKPLSVVMAVRRSVTEEKNA